MNLTLAGGIAVALYGAHRLRQRLRLSRAKHPSLAGHARISRLLAAQVPYYEYDDDEAFRCDGADPDIGEQRKRAFLQLAGELSDVGSTNRELTKQAAPMISDMQFTDANRVPFQFRTLVNRHFRSGAFASATSDVRVRDTDGNWSYDLAGSYGVNLLGYDFYKACIDRAVHRAHDLGPVLGPYHPVVSDNVQMIRAVSGMDEVSFHMSGTEAVMQAVRLARFHTGRKQLVVSCGAYHGWWDGVQAGVGHRRSVSDIYMLKDQSDDTLDVLRTRTDIACVLVNPLQALHPNSGASSDAMLVDSGRSAAFDKASYSNWLEQLREVCTERGIILIFDEVFVGFRLGIGGAQEFFGVQADIVTYGKTIGGGMPVGVVAGRANLMKRFKADRPADMCFARGTFNSHPYVMTAMNEFLRYATGEEFAAQASAAEGIWNERVAAVNERLESSNLPVRIHNIVSICLLEYTKPGRFNWMLQYYLRAQGLALAWTGTGRFIFSHNYTDNDFYAVSDRIVAAVQRMQDDGWWSAPAALTNDSIRKQVFREILQTRFRGRRGTSGRSTPLSGDTTANDSTF